MRLFSFAVAVIILINPHTFCQQSPPKRELRAVWVASVANIDWPSRKGLSTESQKNEFTNLVKRHKQNGMNALFVQVRPSCDAFYDSNIEPWSEWLSGIQGKAPLPFYDPLAFMIEVTHQHGMEFHAWFNPYRAVINKTSSSIAKNHISVQRPDWIQIDENLKILDPGLPEVRNYVAKVVMDVVRRYDIDGVHFDDYFYPYPKKGVVFQDDKTFKKYSKGIKNIHDWRRNNINTLIKMISDSINSVKPNIKYGVSPFGIWRNKNSHPSGSNTSGFESYNGIYCDPITWLKEGYVDYVLPQIYWSIGFPAADFSELALWWSRNTYGKHIYVGHGAYKIENGAADFRWENKSEMPNQIRMVRNITELRGSTFFSSKSISNNLGGVEDSLRKEIYKYPAFPPVMNWKDTAAINSPINLNISYSSDGIKMQWENNVDNSSGKEVFQYVVYRFRNREQINLNDPRAIRSVQNVNNLEFIDTQYDEFSAQFVYAVTAMDRLWNESKPVLKEVKIFRMNESPIIKYFE